jgi:hypothetical protein
MLICPKILLSKILISVLSEQEKEVVMGKLSPDMEGNYKYTE